MEYTEIRHIIQKEYEKQTTDTNYNFISRFANAIYEAQQQVKKINIPDVDKSVYSKCGCGGNKIPTEDGLVCDICG